MTFRVLIADSDLEAARQLSTGLEMSGHLAFVAGSGPEAISVAGQFKPQVAIIGLELGGLGGYDVARHLRGQALGKFFLIAIGDYATDRDRDLALRSGFDAYFSKPVNHVLVNAKLAEFQYAGRPFGKR